MQARSSIEADLQHPQNQTAFHNTRLLVGSYLGISALTLAAIVALRNDVTLTPTPVWVREIIVFAHAVLMMFLVALTARGSRRGYLLLRLTSSIMVVAIVVILAIPGDFPLWFKIDQGICGLLLLGVVMIINDKRIRAVFATFKK
jgi:hypothetical protein